VSEAVVLELAAHFGLRNHFQRRFSYPYGYSRIPRANYERFIQVVMPDGMAVESDAGPLPCLLVQKAQFASLEFRRYCRQARCVECFQQGASLEFDHAKRTIVLVLGPPGTGGLVAFAQFVFDLVLMNRNLMPRAVTAAGIQLCLDDSTYRTHAGAATETGELRLLLEVAVDDLTATQFIFHDYHSAVETRRRLVTAYKLPNLGSLITLSTLPWPCE